MCQVRDRVVATTINKVDRESQTTRSATARQTHTTVIAVAWLLTYDLIL